MGAALLAAIDAPTATVIGAVIAGAFGLALRWTPKTRSEAGVDRATARKADAESWALLQKAWEDRNADLTAEVQRLRDRIVVAEAEAREAREALAEERRHADAQIRELIERITVLEATLPPQRVWFRE